VDVVSGNLINPSQCYQVNDISSPVNYHWDLNESFAVSNASNSGKDILTAWYNGTNIVYKYSFTNTMAFRMTKPNDDQADSLGSDLVASAANLKPGTPYTLLDLSGRVLKKANTDGNGGIQLGDIAPGMHLLQTSDNTGRAKTIKIVK